MTDYPVGQWIGWNGGECPVHPLTEVEFLLADSRQFTTNYVGLFNWSQPLLFRIVTPYVEPAPKLECWVVAHKDGYVSGSYRSEGLAAEAQRIFGGRVVRMVEADG